MTRPLGTVRAGVVGVMPALDCDAVAPLQPAAFCDEAGAVGVVDAVVTLPGVDPPPPPHPVEASAMPNSMNADQRAIMPPFYPPQTARQTCARRDSSAPRAQRVVGTGSRTARDAPCSRGRP